MWESVHLLMWAFSTGFFCTSTHIRTRVGVRMSWVSTIHSHTHTHTHASTHAHARTEQRIQLRSAAHPRLSNILSAQPKNHNWTLWEALIQSTVTMLSETKSTACSQHINSHLTLSPYLSPSLSLSPCFLYHSRSRSLSPLCLCCLVFFPILAASLPLTLSLLHRCVIELLNMLLKLTYCTRMPNIDRDFLCSSFLGKSNTSTSSKCVGTINRAFKNAPGVTLH